ncbi:MAG: VWA domain-containing protein [Myxococcales bacterium]|nr:VWA domain-containing protein [Myxococcales bacterium]
MTLFGIELAHPWYLLAALAIAPVVLLSRHAAGRVQFSSLAALPHGATWRTSLAWLPDALYGLAVLALALALAGPQRYDGQHRIKRRGIAVMMVVDHSGSMQALDLSDQDHEQTRLDAVKRVFEQFVLGGGGLGGRPDDAIGLIAFARYADTLSPLTLDHANLATAARQVEIVTEQREDGTAVGDGLAQAVERLRAAPQASKVAIVLTDGVSNVGEVAPLAAASLARDASIKVYTVGAGTNGRAPVRVPSRFGGGTELVSMQVQIDEDTLRKIAEATGGRYFRATDLDGLRQVYKEIDRLERTEIDETQGAEPNQLYGYLVALAMLAIAGAVTLRATLLRRLP